MFFLGTLTLLASGCQLGFGLVMPIAESRGSVAGDLDKRIPGVIPIQQTTSNLWKYSKCQWDPDLATLRGYTFYSNSMTPDLCTTTCASRGFTYAGVRDRNYCGCGNNFNSGYAIDKSNCQYWSCSGAPSIACGGDFALSIYVVDDAAVSASSSLSASRSASVASSLSASSSASLSVSRSASASLALSASQSASASAAVAASASNSLSLSASNSMSLSASVSASAYASLQASLSASASVASSLSASGSAATSRSASASAASALAASASAASSLAASASVASSVAASISASASAASSVSAAAVAATATPSPWVPASTACVAEGSAGRALNGDSTSAPDMTFTKCLSYCGAKGFAIAGLEFGSECYCGNALVNGASLTKTSGQCNMACSGSPSKTCGGSDALTVFVIPSKITSLSADLTAKTASLPAGWSSNSITCVAEPNNGRALTGAATSANDMTPAKCSSFCADRGFKYAGVEYGSECYCGNSFDNGANPNISSTQCNMGCSGDINTMCGGPGAMNVFTNPSIVPPVSSSNKPVVTGSLPNGWSAASTQCIQEVSGRALTGSSIAGPSMTISICLSFCQVGGFQYAGLEYGSECYCGAALTNGASLSQTSGQCNMACASDSTSSCGGSNAIQLYQNPSLAPVAAPAPVAPPVIVVNGFSSSGCIQEVSGRALTGLRVDYTDMTIDKCTAACAQAGFKFAGVEYGQECYCGNTLVNGASLSSTSGQCYMDCPGDASMKCGGPNAIQLYAAK